MEILDRQEGLIRFQIRHKQAPPVLPAGLSEINAWRKILFLTRLIGRDPGRYAGAGYGNISQRQGPFDAPKHRRRFIISGTQTGGLAALTEEHYTVVLECNPYQNLVVSEGPLKPSSESLTHGILYDLDHRIRFVMHVHSPHIWRSADALKIAVTRKEAVFGTPEMAEEVRRLFEDTQVRTKYIFAMGGHEDGVVSFGRTASEAGTALLNYLALSFQLLSLDS